MEFSNQSMNVIYYALNNLLDNETCRYAVIKALDEWESIDSDMHTKKEIDD